MHCRKNAVLIFIVVPVLLVCCALGEIKKEDIDGGMDAAGINNDGGDKDGSAGDGGGDTDSDSDSDNDSDSDSDAGGQEDASSDASDDAGGDTDSDVDGDWDDNFCGTPAVLEDTGLLGPTVNWTDSVQLPALGNLRIMQLEIELPDRECNLGGSQPFDDLTLTATSPSGTLHVFWARMRGTKQGNDYAFPTIWHFPQFWDETTGGEWTLKVTDHMGQCLAKVDNNIAKWCFKPLDPDGFSGVDPSAASETCNNTQQTLKDLEEAIDPQDNDVDYPVYSTIQVLEFVKAGSAPEITLDIDHNSAQDVEIKLITSDGRSLTVKDDGSGSIPSTYTVSGMAGAWITGHWQLRVVDLEDNDVEGTLNSWCVRANQ